MEETLSALPSRLRASLQTRGGGFQRFQSPMDNLENVAGAATTKLGRDFTS